ncbi:MAG: trypsin-like peptidase domain-containing protein [Bacilli bacterium]|nr:trypsin-like peptidase domain-containing protein [Bacilli bacterium]
MKKEEKTKISTKYKKNNYVYVVVICILVLILFGFIIGIKSNMIKNANNADLEETIELKHTTTANVKSSGVYITDVSDVVDEVMPSIVAITSKTIINSGMFGPNRYTAEGAGSGVIVAESDSELFILTNYHVVEDTSELSVTFVDTESYDASVKGVSKRKDIAIVSVKKKNISSETLKQIKIATLGNSDELKVGNGIITIGNALGYGQSVTTGIVSAINREVSTDEYVQSMIQIDAAINGGNSGGALLNSKGEVVGINTIKYSSNSSRTTSSIEGMGFAIPISDIEDIIKDLINGKDDEGVSLGIEGYMNDSNSKIPEGFYVTSIITNSNADNSNLEIGSIIVSIDDNKVTSVDSIRKVLNNKKKGDTIKLKIKYPDKNEYKEKEIIIKLN